MYYFIEKNEQIGGAFADALGGVLSICAQEISIEVEPIGEGVDIETIETGFPHSKLGQKWIINIPDLYYEEKRDMLMKISVKDFNTLTPIHNPLAEMERMEEEDAKVVENKKEFHVARAKLSYFDVDSKKVVEMYAFVKIAVANDGENFNEQDPKNLDLSVDEQKNRLIAQKAIEEALQKKGLEEAQKVINNAKIQIGNSKSNNTTFTTGLLNQMNAQFDGISNQQTYEVSGKKKLTSWSRAHKMQRNADGGQELGIYQNQRQQEMKDAFKGLE